MIVAALATKQDTW